MDKDLLLKRSCEALLHARNVIDEISEGNATEQLDCDIEAILKGERPSSQNWVLAYEELFGTDWMDGGKEK